VLLMQRLSHPNIVAFRDSFFVDGKDSLCIVMTYCDGGDLSSRITAQKGQLFKEDQVMSWFVQCALAVEYMHANKVSGRQESSAWAAPSPCTVCPVVPASP
jgi:NIMA (never in mitosis gene a)-related kinase